MARESLKESSLAKTMLDFHMKDCEMSTTLPMLKVGGHLTKDISFESKMFLRMLDSIIKDHTGRLAAAFT
jgi:hypothetical protein